MGQGFLGVGGGGRSRDSGNEKASYGTGANDVAVLPAVSILRRRIGLIMQLSSKAIVPSGPSGAEARALIDAGRARLKACPFPTQPHDFS